MWPHPLTRRSNRAKSCLFLGRRSKTQQIRQLRGRKRFVHFTVSSGSQYCSTNITRVGKEAMVNSYTIVHHARFSCVAALPSGANPPLAARTWPCCGVTQSVNYSPLGSAPLCGDADTRPAVLVSSRIHFHWIPKDKLSRPSPKTVCKKPSCIEAPQSHRHALRLLFTHLPLNLLGSACPASDSRAK